MKRKRKKTINVCAFCNVGLTNKPDQQATRAKKKLWRDEGRWPFKWPGGVATDLRRDKLGAIFVRQIQTFG